MWILPKHAKQLALTHAELESLILERTTELQNLSQRLLQVQDEERRKVARDLHDTTGQTLAALVSVFRFFRKAASKTYPG
jgi:signal transduction histidine kinase